MGGSSAVEDDWDLASTNDAITLVLVGKLGYGKSATGNSILGRKEFESTPGMTGVTSTCQMESTVRDGRTINVIDTPGMFDWSIGLDEVGKEIVKCINLAKDGIHAVIMVFSIRSRFSEGEETTLERLQMFFGEKIVDYMIIVFTGGDDLEEDKTFTDYLGRVPEPVQNIIQTCKNRVVLFNNRTKDENEKNAQVQRLLFHIDSVIVNNGGEPFSDIIFRELKQRALKLQGALELHDKEKVNYNLKGYSAEQIAGLKEEIYKVHKEQLACITEMVEQKLNRTIERLEKELKEEQTARLEAQKKAEDAMHKYDDEILKLKESLQKAEKENEEFKRQAQEENEEFKRQAQEENEEFKRQAQGGRCAIL